MDPVRGDVDERNPQEVIQPGLVVMFCLLAAMLEEEILELEAGEEDVPFRQSIWLHLGMQDKAAGRENQGLLEPSL